MIKFFDETGAQCRMNLHCATDRLIGQWISVLHLQSVAFLNLRETSIQVDQFGGVEDGAAEGSEAVLFDDLT